MNYFCEEKPITADKRMMILAHHHSDGTTLPPFIHQTSCMEAESHSLCIANTKTNTALFLRP